MPAATITVFEHQKLKLNQTYKGICFSDSYLKALQQYHGEKGTPFFSLIHNGVQFNEHVGVLQVGTLRIEVLPKVEHTQMDAQGSSEGSWRDLLIDMFKVVQGVEAKSNTHSFSRVKSNSILDLYFMLFLQEVEELLHRGLIKRYRTTEGNQKALKGSLRFAPHLRENLVHKERFFVRYTTYDHQHLLHQILYKTLALIQTLSSNAQLSTSVGAVLLRFPEMEPITVTEATFERIPFDRKNSAYQKAIQIARLLLLNYHPDVQQGRHDVLALMFDMNALWEEFIFMTLKKAPQTYSNLRAQHSKPFWKPLQGGRSVGMKPDITYSYNGQTIVLDTKWKNIQSANPSVDDLRQLYVYHEYFDAQRVALVYPGKQDFRNGHYFNFDQSASEKECAVICLDVHPRIRVWQEEIREKIRTYLHY